MANAKKVKRKSKYARRERFPDFMAFIATKRCICCNRWPVEVAHCGDRAYGQKCSDLETLPICSRHHQRGEPESIHTLGKKFWEHWGLSREGLVEYFKAQYEEYRILNGIAGEAKPTESAESNLPGELPVDAGQDR